MYKQFDRSKNQEININEYCNYQEVTTCSNCDSCKIQENLRAMNLKIMQEIAGP